MIAQHTGFQLFAQIYAILALILIAIIIVVMALSGFFRFRGIDPNKEWDDDDEDFGEEDRLAEENEKRELERLERSRK